MKNNIKNKLIILSSITYAYKAKDILYNSGIKGYIERVPVGMRENGCGYGVKINPIDLYKTLDILKDASIKVKDILDL